MSAPGVWFVLQSRVVAKSLKVLLSAIETSASAVQSLRCDMKELPLGRVQIFTEKKQKALLPLFNMRSVSGFSWDSVIRLRHQARQGRPSCI